MLLAGIQEMRNAEYEIPYCHSGLPGILLTNDQ